MKAEMFLVSGCLFVLILAVGQLFVKKKQPANKILFFLFIVCFCWIGHGIGYRLSWISGLPHLNKIHVPFICATGPLWYAYLRSLHNDVVDTKFWYRSGALVMSTVLLSIPFYLQSATYKQEYIEVNIIDVASATMYVATRFAELTVIYYAIKALMYLGGFLNFRSLITNINTSSYLWVFSLFGLVAAIFRLFGSIAGNHTISVVIPCLIVIVLSVAMYILSYQRPVVLSLSQHAARHIKTTSVADQKLLEQCKERIRTEKWFLEPNVKILFVARKLGIPANQLSELINNVAGVNFNEFVNKFRIEHAQNLLLHDPKKPVLDIAYESGFNSKSAFYKQFTAVTGTTPAQFRRTCAIEESPDQCDESV